MTKRKRREFPRTEISSKGERQVPTFGGGPFPLNIPRQIRKLLLPSFSKKPHNLRDKFLAKQTTHTQQTDLHDLCTWRREATVYSRKDQGNLE
jgi:hypothetical protein